MTVNEARDIEGLPKIKGGDVPLNAVFVQRLGQQMQQDSMDTQQQTARLQQLQTAITQAQTEPQPEEIPSGISYQDVQAGLNGKSAKATNKKGMSGTGKDGQLRDEKNTASVGQGGKDRV